VSDEQHADVTRLLEALSLRDSNQLQRIAIDTEKKYLGTSLADAARDSEAIALEMKGWREAAKKAVQQIANSTKNPEVKQRADALLQSPEYNLLTPFQEARSERQLQSAKYVLFGEDFLQEHAFRSRRHGGRRPGRRRDTGNGQRAYHHQQSLSGDDSESGIRAIGHRCRGFLCAKSSGLRERF
jgi:hypothetical protein